MENYLLAWLFFGCLIAFQWSAWFGSEAFDPFEAGKSTLGYVIALTMFCIGSLIPADEVAEVLRRWRSVLGGTVVQYAAMPLLAYAVVQTFGLEGGWKIGVMVAGCVPGAMASNVLTLMARGNVSYSVSLTTCATLLSPLIVPWVLKLALLGEVEHFPVAKTFLELCQNVVLPVILGHFFTRAVEKARPVMEQLSPIVANCTILWIIAVVVGANRARISDIPVAVILALLLLNLAGYAAGFLGGTALRLDRPMRMALTLEVGMQNAGLGAFLAIGLFPDQAVANLPPVLYAFGCMMTGAVLARVFAELADRRRVARYTNEKAVS